MLVLTFEGGFSDHPADPGGETMKGVTLTTFRHYFGAHATKADLLAITDAQLQRVYRTYWDACGCDSLPSGLDLAVFDFAINSGPSQARKLLSKARTIEGLCDARLAFLRHLPTWGHFGKGWQRRVDDVRDSALAMALSELPDHH
ncbi:glycosyl hydrolase 108 family protein [uncultured Thiodictyon sp.]|uniref:glycoside hydrolase family 108 protein n=1 Tax=uncultured Thiodictyon sp. TaxID=1846217 RepID=UPI0025FC0AFF|nr:glycosyl hydrolase 108 family protein [uncultured Thiodictyon sp.]